MCGAPHPRTRASWSSARGTRCRWGRPRCTSAPVGSTDTWSSLCYGVPFLRGHHPAPSALLPATLARCAPQDLCISAIVAAWDTLPAQSLEALPSDLMQVRALVFATG